jgi:superfamily I DNA and RNA helicase
MKETWWVRPDQLDEDQKRIITLPIDKDYLITGPPGSGKTNLLLLRANFLVKSGLPDIVILVFTRTLKEFISTGASQYSLASDKILTSLRKLRLVALSF